MSSGRHQRAGQKGALLAGRAADRLPAPDHDRGARSSPGCSRYWAFQLKLETSFGDLLPQSHPFVQIHNRYARHVRRREQHPADGRGEGGPHLHRPDPRPHLQDHRGGRPGLRREPQPDRLDRPPHDALPAARSRAASSAPSRSMIGLPKTAGRRRQHPAHRPQHRRASTASWSRSTTRAALVRANFIEGRLDHRRTFTEINERVIAPFEKGWIGALIKGKDPSSPTRSRRRWSRSSIAARRRATPSSRPATSSRRSTATPTHRPRRAWRQISKYQPGDRASTLGYKRGDETEDGQITIPTPDIDIFVAGEPRLYGWVYNYAGDVFLIFTVTYCIEWILRWMYFHDWRGALRPTLTGRHRRVLGTRLHPPDRLRARPAHPGDAVPHHRARRESRDPDARPLLRGIRAAQLGPAAGDRRGVRASSSCRRSRAS